MEGLMLPNGKSTIHMAEPALEKHYSIIELSKLWSLSQRTILRLFADEPGVLRYSSAHKSKRKRAYTTVRIPESVAVRVHERSAGKSTNRR